MREKMRAVLCQFAIFANQRTKVGEKCLIPPTSRHCPETVESLDQDRGKLGAGPAQGRGVEIIIQRFIGQSAVAL